jgi:hypothetical protein
MDAAHFDHLTTDRFSPLGAMPVLLVEAAGWEPPAAPISAIIIGVDREGRLPLVAPDHFDLLLTTATGAAAPWVVCRRIDTDIERLQDAVRQWPMAATMLCEVLRVGDALPFSARLKIESMAYSALLGGSEFANWRTALSPTSVPHSDGNLVDVKRDGDAITLTLNLPDSHNAMTAAMRDALYSELANVIDDPTAPTVQLQGAGRCFSTGGALGEFGSAQDLAAAHVVRSIRNVAALLDGLGARASVHVHGACIGSGIEIAAAAAKLSAARNSWFQLPELRMGLIPGAGGTASIARRIGRHRTAWLVLNGKRIGAGQALDWGLIDVLA